MIEILDKIIDIDAGSEDYTGHGQGFASWHAASDPFSHSDFNCRGYTQGHSSGSFSPFEYDSCSNKYKAISGSYGHNRICHEGLCDGSGYGFFAAKSIIDKIGRLMNQDFTGEDLEDYDRDFR